MRRRWIGVGVGVAILAAFTLLAFSRQPVKYAFIPPGVEYSYRRRSTDNWVTEYRFKGSFSEVLAKVQKELELPPKAGTPYGGSDYLPSSAEVYSTSKSAPLRVKIETDGPIDTLNGYGNLVVQVWKKDASLLDRLCGWLGF